ncbi:hypothetical protein AMECASPLE_012471, partial [Ameca splendens]
TESRGVARWRVDRFRSGKLRVRSPMAASKACWKSWQRRRSQASHAEISRLSACVCCKETYVEECKETLIGKRRPVGSQMFL